MPSMTPRRRTTPADQQGRQRCFCAFALDGLHLFVLEQRRRQAAKFGIVFDVFFHFCKVMHGRAKERLQFTQLAQ